MTDRSFSLRVPQGEVAYWASQYPIPTDYEVENVIAPSVKARGYFEKAEFLRLCEWKTPRSRRFCGMNSDEFIQAVTQTALCSPSEQLRIEVLTLLHGVHWPTASVILHFGQADPYPILDFRSLWSLGVVLSANEPYDFGLWWSYTEFCRQLASEINVSMRTLDRALWQYSKANQ